MKKYLLLVIIVGCDAHQEQQAVAEIKKLPAHSDTLSYYESMYQYYIDKMLTLTYPDNHFGLPNANEEMVALQVRLYSDSSMFYWFMAEGATEDSAKRYMQDWEPELQSEYLDENKKTFKSRYCSLVKIN